MRPTEDNKCHFFGIYIFIIVTYKHFFFLFLNVSCIVNSFFWHKPLWQQRKSAGRFLSAGAGTRILSASVNAARVQRRDIWDNTKALLHILIIVLH